MKILILGASGHIGRRLLQMLGDEAWAEPVGASRRLPGAASSGAWRQVNTLQMAGMSQALRDFDAVVNCVAGDARSISGGARVLVEAALAAQCPRIVHLSTMSVYGPAEGLVTEDTPLDPRLGWYGQAKCEAEAHLRDFVRWGGQAVVLRPGCVFGPGSELWVGRIGRWLQAGRLGDLGVAGDGWSNLVHVDDVCRALMAALRLKVWPAEMPAFNLAAPDSPRWNEYFVDLALAIGATPVRRLGQRQLKLDAWLAGPPLKIAERILQRLGRNTRALPDPLPPGLLRLWSQHIRLDSQAATRQLALAWTPYETALQSSASWFAGRAGPAAAPGKVECTT